MKALFFALVAVLAANAGAAPARLPGPAFPDYPTPAALSGACDDGLRDGAARVKAFERHAPDAGWLGAWDDLNSFIEDASGPFYLIENVHPQSAVRDAAQACTLRWNEFGTALGQNEALYRALGKVKPRDAIDRELVALAREGFDDAGMSLPADKRARAKQINDRLSDLAQQFGKRIREENTKLAFAPAELAGVPEPVWKDKPRDDAGRVQLGLDYPSYVPVLERAENGATRERMWRAKLQEGGTTNLKLLAEMAQLRREYAQLFGLTSFDDFQLRRRMVESTARALAFLDEVKVAVTEREQRDIDELRAAKASHLGLPLAAAKLERWDVSFYTERVRLERYSVDQEAFRTYFPPQESLRFVMRIAEKAFGLRYTRVDGKFWHDDVQAYAVSDVTSGKAIAALYVDLFPRDGKYNHAAVWPVRSAALRHGRAAQAALVVNMDRKGLSLGELETLLHEFGHAVHNNVSATRYAQLASSSVQRDFIEAPSQMPEDWVYDKRVLRLFADVCPACQPVPDRMIEQARVARDYGKGLLEARQHLFASYDLALYGAQDLDPLALWERMEGATPLGHVPGSIFPAGFTHIASGYAAGYYGYLWSLVVAHDLRTAFAPDRLDAVVGARYRATVLSQGRQRPPRELVRDFLGRETNSKAFFEDLKR